MMTVQPTSWEELATLAAQLPAVDKVRLVERVMADLEQELTPAEPPTANRSLYGVLAHLGTAPSLEEIQEARREAWANFPREDLY